MFAMEKACAKVDGLAKVPAVREMLAGLTGRKMITLPVDGQLAAAFGAALIAQGKKIQRRKKNC